MTGTPLYILFGDFEAAVIDILSTSTEVSGFSVDKITTDMIGYDRTKSWVLVEMEGGSYKFKYVKRPRIDITVYAPTRSRAYDISAVIQAVMFAQQGVYGKNGVRICAVQLETDIFRSSEKDTDSIRYIQSLRLVCSYMP